MPMGVGSLEAYQVEPGVLTVADCSAAVAVGPGHWNGTIAMQRTQAARFEGPEVLSALAVALLAAHAASSGLRPG